MQHLVTMYLVRLSSDAIAEYDMKVGLEKEGAVVLNLSRVTSLLIDLAFNNMDFLYFILKTTNTHITHQNRKELLESPSDSETLTLIENVRVISGGWSLCDLVLVVQDQEWLVTGGVGNHWKFRSINRKQLA